MANRTIDILTLRSPGPPKGAPTLLRPRQLDLQRSACRAGPVWLGSPHLSLGLPGRPESLVRIQPVQVSVQGVLGVRINGRQPRLQRAGGTVGAQLLQV